MSVYKAYAACSNKDAPEAICQQAANIAKWLESEGFTLRTNGCKALGDHVEEAVENKEIYLPWNKFNDKKSQYKVTDPAIELACKFHPKLKDLKESIQKIVGADSVMMLGENLRDPVKFLMVWTYDGAETSDKVTFKTGYSGQAIKIACASKIPVFNLQNPGAEQKLKEFAATVQGIELNF